MERSPVATHGNCVACNSSSNSLVGVSSASGKVTNGSVSSSSTIFSSDERNRICSWLSADGFVSFISLAIVGWVRLIVTNSDMEFFMSFKSRFNAIALISDVDDDDDDVDEDTWCKRCDDDVLATRDVVVLDLVDDVLLLFNTWANEKKQKQKILIRCNCDKNRRLNARGLGRQHTLIVWKRATHSTDERAK